MSNDTDFDVTEAMIVYGGGFVSLLGKLFRQADARNKAILKAAFPDYWRTYTELAVLKSEKNV
jgi:hypothetical protein